MPGASLQLSQLWAQHDGLRVEEATQADDRQKALQREETNATMWSFPVARVLSVQEIGKLMGHDMCNTEVSGISETNLRNMLGLSLHVGTAGLIVCCRIASLAFAP